MTSLFFSQNILALKLEVGKEYRLYHNAHISTAITYAAVGGMPLVEVKPADRQVLFAIHTMMEVPCEKRIAVKTEIMNNWDEYWRASEKLKDKVDPQDDDPRTGKEWFRLVEKSQINEVDRGDWRQILRFLP